MTAVDIVRQIVARMHIRFVFVPHSRARDRALAVSICFRRGRQMADVSDA
ncbi:hypothetical protein [Bradyrhizobium sp. STM 3557]